MNRIIGIDLVKVFAVFFVPSVHFFLNTNFYSVDLIASKSLFVQTYLRWLFLICVPLFMITTGYLMSKKQLSGKYYKGLLSVLGVYLFYSICAIVIRTYYGEEKSVLSWISAIFNFTANSYAWYVNMYIGLFLLIPFLNLIYHNLKSKKEKTILILTFFFICGIPNFVNSLPMPFVNFPNWWVNIYPLAYYFIGCYIKEFKPKMNKPLAIVLFGIVILFETLLTYYFAHGGPFVDAAGYYGSIVVMTSAVLFFLIFYDIDFNNQVVSKILALIGSLTLDIYLASNIVDLVVYKYVRGHIFESNIQIIYYFVPIVGTIIILSLTISIIRKFLTDLSLRIYHKVVVH